MFKKKRTKKKRLTDLGTITYNDKQVTSNQIALCAKQD